MTYLPDALAAYRIHGTNAGFGNVASAQETICMWEFLLANPNFRRFLSNRHAKLLRAKILERKAYLASRTGQKVLAGAWAGLRVPFILAANGYRCNWKHLALPAACLLPIKRSRVKSRSGARWRCIRSPQIHLLRSCSDDFTNPSSDRRKRAAHERADFHHYSHAESFGDSRTMPGRASGGRVRPESSRSNRRRRLFCGRYAQGSGRIS